MSFDLNEHNERVRQQMEELGKAMPQVMSKFAMLQNEVSGNGALSTKMKELIALAIGITVRCDGCIAYHIYDALEAGATRQEILETISVAILMGGGPSVVYGTEALKALEQYEAKTTMPVGNPLEMTSIR